MLHDGHEKAALVVRADRFVKVRARDLGAVWGGENTVQGMRLEIERPERVVCFVCACSGSFVTIGQLRIV